MMLLHFAAHAIGYKKSVYGSFSASEIDISVTYVSKIWSENLNNHRFIMCKQNK